METSQLWPNVHYIDIYNYLINSTSEFSGSALKSYKSLEAYKYFVAGWVADQRACRLSTVYGKGNNNNRLLTAKVQIICSLSYCFAFVLCVCTSALMLQTFG